MNELKTDVQYCLNCGNRINSLYEDIAEAVSFLKTRIVSLPKVGIICGTGLGSIAEALHIPIKVKYEEIPHFPVSTVEGHAGQLIFGFLAGIPTVCMQGRLHFHEGYPLWKCTMPVRVMKALGVNHIIISNAVGGINPNYKVGDIMLIKDHINLMGLAAVNPLTGINDERLGQKFLSLTETYDMQLISTAKEIAKEQGIDNIVREGVLTCVAGPTFETIAECRMLAMLGVDAVGMSNVPEAIVAKHCDMTVLSFSLITNICSLDYNSQEDISHIDVMNVGNSRRDILKKFVEKIVEHIGQSCISN